MTVFSFFYVINNGQQLDTNKLETLWPHLSQFFLKHFHQGTLNWHILNHRLPIEKTIETDTRNTQISVMRLNRNFNPVSRVSVPSLSKTAQQCQTNRPVYSLIVVSPQRHSLYLPAAASDWDSGWERLEVSNRFNSSSTVFHLRRLRRDETVGERPGFTSDKSLCGFCYSTNTVRVWQRAGASHSRQMTSPEAVVGH